MTLAKLAWYLERLESTPKRLEITSILSELIQELKIDEVDKALYLSLGYLKAPYESEKFNIADKLMIRALARQYHKENEIAKIYGELGDLGSVAFKLHNENTSSEISILQAHQKLTEIAQASGTGSQEAKINKIVDLIQKLNKVSAKYIVRMILGTTRLGFTELTIVDALAQSVKQGKSLAKKIEEKYSIHPDIGLIAKVIIKNKNNPEKALNEIKITTGVPILAQKAQRLGTMEEIVEKLGSCWAEYKFDGTRLQLHLDKNKKFVVNTKQTELFDNPEKEKYLVKTFTRNMEDTTYQYPDLLLAADKQINAVDVILDGEIMGIDKKTGEFLPFQQIMQRKRKYSIKEFSHDIPIRYYVFDILYLNGAPLIEKTLEERHAILEKIIKSGDTIKVAKKVIINDADDLTEYYEEAKSLNLEGLIIKKPKDIYQAGARSFSWVKLKKADEELLKDSVDVVVLGYYFGKGERSKFGIGKFLVGVYDEKRNVFVSLTKVGTGLTDEDWGYIKKEADKYKTAKLPNNVLINKAYNPDVVLNPKLVVEIGGDEITISKSHSSGYGLRFPRLLHFREDKNASQSTTLAEIKKLYSLQERGIYN
ncbi:hypothetical protein A2V49_01755 [candidate division WWE3 bacterium RBG_19FT_COMBO_34_6]|uniref:DNA ligase (ATP) n=1 Tax=candidate division WWE3 bacterium RBG_19FT_COMBO_34_6 TaxID=1802612 RepID=A0A1F4UK56_UNCKA|nr:MAG: hypothetical protein A2V49_01755 [candidate division WWE3 bacterium RBG_19FT_COMBO_34_6]